MKSQSGIFINQSTKQKWWRVEANLHDFLAAPKKSNLTNNQNNKLSDFRSIITNEISIDIKKK